MKNQTPIVLILEPHEDIGKILKNIAENKAMLVDWFNNFTKLESLLVPRKIRENRYEFVVINYKWAKCYKPLDILALIKKAETPFALIYTDFSPEIDMQYEALSQWSFKVTDEYFNNAPKLTRDLEELFSPLPAGSLKYVVK